MKGIVLHSNVPVRAEGREQAEQTTQLLFGELVEIRTSRTNQTGQTDNRWVEIKSLSDGQEGWCDKKMITPLSSEEWKQVAGQERVARVCLPMTYAVSENNGQTIPLSLGTILPDYKDGRFSILGVGFRIDAGAVAVKPLELNEQNLLTVCRFMLNVPYLWGGRNALGMDCSGFSQQVMSLFGIALKRNASEQAKQGRKVRYEDIQAGDLCFFNHGEGTGISHVGIAIDKDRIIHCSGRVKVETLTKEGIVSAEAGGLTHNLLFPRRLEAARAAE